MVLLFGCTHTKNNHLQWQCNSISREPKEFCYVPLEEWVASLRHFNLRGTSLEQQLRATEVWSFFQNPQWSFTVPPEGLQDRQHHSWHFCEPKVRRSEQGITKAFPFRCYVIYILSVDADLHPISVEASDLTWIGQCLWSRSLFCSWNVKTFRWISACLAMLLHDQKLSVQPHPVGHTAGAVACYAWPTWSPIPMSWWCQLFAPGCLGLRKS